MGAELNEVPFVAIDVEWFASLDALEQALRTAYIPEGVDELKTRRPKTVIYPRTGAGYWLDITGCGIRSRASFCASLWTPDVVGAKSKPSRKLGEPIAAASGRRVEMSLDAADKSVCATILAQAFSMRSGGLSLFEAINDPLTPGRTLDLSVFDQSLFSARPAARAH
jgi:hypothetical protein